MKSRENFAAWAEDILENGAEAQSPNEVGGFGSEYAQRFISTAEEALKVYYRDPDLVRRIEIQGGKIIGPSYFNGLFEEKNAGDDAGREMIKLKSIFTGSIAYGIDDLAAEAYRILMTLPEDERDGVRAAILSNMDVAIRNEALLSSSDAVDRQSRLEAVSIYLGKPLRERVATGISTTVRRFAL